MASQPEALLSRRIVKALQERGAFASKIHGSSYQKKGLPDIVGCYRGRFFGVETKMPGNAATPLQAHRIAEIQKAGGVASVCHSVERALALLDFIDEQSRTQPR